MSLSDLFAACGTDKQSDAHSYGPTYDHLLAPYQACRAVLEIGVLGGASLRAWRQFFCPETRVVGIDKNLTCGPVAGVELFQADSMDPQSVASVLGASRFDVIIDDGGHGLWEQSATWDALQSYLEPGGLFCVEDLQSTEARVWFAERGFLITDLTAERPGRWDNVLVHYHRPKV